MTKFVKDQFHGSEYVEYFMQPLPLTLEDRKFVGRFKRGGKASFISFLIKNFTVEEYFARIDAGEAPLSILESKGYLLPHIKRWLKEGGYELSQAGFRKMIDDQIAARQAVAQ